MARPKEFDVDEALENALMVFWSKGYEATSVQDLVEAMGIRKASLYGTFGDKHSLYLATLRHYQDVRLGEIVQMIEDAPSGRAAIEGLLTGVAKHAAGSERGRGCFCVNASNELAPHDAEVGALMQSHGRRVEALFAGVLERAKEEGDLPRKADSKRLATFIHGLVLALNVFGKQRASKERLQVLVDQGLSVFAS